MNDALTPSQAALDFIAAQEGFRASVYRDAAGIETIGYGHRLIEGECFPDGIGEDAAKRLLASDAARAETAVRAQLTVPLTQGQFDALVSFVFNIGAGAFASSTLLRKLNDGDIAGAADEFLRWNKITSGGALIAEPGLTARRAAERQLFLGG